MTPRDNFLSLLRRTGYETAPTAFGLCPSLRETMMERTGTDDPETHFAFPFRHPAGPRLPQREPVDWSAYYDEPLKPGTRFSDWGVAHEPGSADAKHMNHMRHPMENFDSLEQMRAYPVPDYCHADASHLAAEVASIHDRGFASVGGVGSYAWEAAWALRSMPELMADMMAEDEKAAFVLDLCADAARVKAEAYARAGCDLIHGGDDVGMQHALMMSPALWRAWLKPRLASVVAAAKAIKPDLLFSYHSCGYVEPFIDDFIEIGIDVLNPVQPECMDFGAIHAAYGERLSFWGTVGTQTTMPFGTPDEVRAVVTKNLDIAGPRGGLFCTPTHLLEPEVPWENVEALVQACKDYRPA